MNAYISHMCDIIGGSDNHKKIAEYKLQLSYEKVIFVYSKSPDEKKVGRNSLIA